MRHTQAETAQRRTSDERDGTAGSEGGSPQPLVDPIEAQIAGVCTLGIDELRAEWRKLFRRAPAPGLTKDVLARMLTARLQERAFGGLDREVAKALDRLARGKPSQSRRRLKTGTVLVREHGGERHTVTVAPDGFVWREEVYPSLSTVARAITGTAWNGPRFFGLRAGEQRGVGGSRGQGADAISEQPRSAPGPRGGRCTGGTRPAVSAGQPERPSRSEKQKRGKDGPTHAKAAPARATGPGSAAPAGRGEVRGSAEGRAGRGGAEALP